MFFQLKSLESVLCGGLFFRLQFLLDKGTSLFGVEKRVRLSEIRVFRCIGEIVLGKNRIDCRTTTGGGPCASNLEFFEPLS